MTGTKWEQIMKMPRAASYVAIAVAFTSTLVVPMIGAKKSRKAEFFESLRSTVTFTALGLLVVDGKNVAVSRSQRPNLMSDTPSSGP